MNIFSHIHKHISPNTKSPINPTKGTILGTHLFCSAPSHKTQIEKNTKKGFVFVHRNQQNKTQFLMGGGCVRRSRSSSRTRTSSCVFLLVVTLLFRPSQSDPSDEACLTHLSQSLQDPNHSLQNWTKSTFANPCSGFTSYLQGATCNNGRIYKLSLTNLSLRGSITPFLANCTNLQSLDLSSNLIAGPIPPELQSLVNLAVLNLSSNRLSGPIPPQLTLCAYLNVIDLHQNLLTGTIPQQLGLLVRLSAFDVSNNKLSGPIPSSLGNRSGSLPRFNATSFAGNKDLYGYPLPPMKAKGLSVLAIVGIGLGSGLASLVLSFTGVCIWLKITERKMALEEGKITQLMPDY